VSRCDDYDVDPERAAVFYKEVRKYYPALPDGALVPDYAGIRPKIQGPGEPARDFLILGPADHGVRGLAHFLGIESPGLTACLALAEECVRVLSHTGLRQM
jgi:L-2-hydroxyglutarate oxidase LhgO